MKLPSGVKLGIKSLGREDVGAPARKFNAEQQASNSMASLVLGSADMVQGIYDAEQSEQAKIRTADVKRDLDLAHTRSNTQASYDLNNPDDVKYLEGSRYEKSHTDGTLRTSIDRSEISSQAWLNNKDKIIKQGLKGLSKRQQGMVNDELTAHIDRLDLNSTRNSIVFKSTALKQKTLSAADKLVTGGDLEGALKLVTTAPQFNEAEKEKIIGQMRVNHELGLIEKTKYDDDPNKAKALAALMSDEEYDGVLQGDQRQAAINSLNNAYKLGTAQQVEAEKTRKAKSTSDLEIAVNRGQASQLDIETAYNSGLFDEKTRTRLILKADSVAEKGVEKSNAKGYVSDILAGQEGIFNPANKDHVKQAETALQDVEDIPTLIRFADKSGYITQNLQDVIEGNAINGDGVKALEIYQRFEDTNKALLAKVDPRAKEILEIASQNTRGGVGAGVAIEQAKELLLVPQEVRDQRKIGYKDALKENPKSLKNMMDADEDLFDLGGGPYSDVSLPSNLAAEFNAGVAKHYVLTGDLELSRRVVYSRLQQTWGISEVGGHVKGGGLTDDKRGMKYPPERMLNVSSSVANSSLKAFAFDKQISLDLDEMIITPTPNTARGVAEYRVTGWDKETEMPYILVDPSTSQPLIWNASEYMQLGQEMQHLEEQAQALIDEGYATESGETTDKAQNEAYSVSAEQILIDDELADLNKLKGSEKYLAAKEVIRNKNASPQQLRDAQEVVSQESGSMNERTRSYHKGMPQF